MEEKESAAYTESQRKITTLAELEKQNEESFSAIQDAKAEVNDMTEKIENLQGEINRLKRCTDSQSRDLKRAIREKDDLVKLLQERTIQLNVVERDIREKDVIIAAQASQAAAWREGSSIQSSVGSPPVRILVFCSYT